MIPPVVSSTVPRREPVERVPVAAGEAGAPGGVPVCAHTAVVIHNRQPSAVNVLCFIWFLNPCPYGFGYEWFLKKSASKVPTYCSILGIDMSRLQSPRDWPWRGGADWKIGSTPATMVLAIN